MVFTVTNDPLVCTRSYGDGARLGECTNNPLGVDAITSGLLALDADDSGRMKPQTLSRAKRNRES